MVSIGYDWSGAARWQTGLFRLTQSTADRTVQMLFAEETINRRSSSLHRGWAYYMRSASVLLRGLMAGFVLSPLGVGAEPPKIERLFPPGGQRGTVVEAKVTGTPGDGPVQVWSDPAQISFVFGEKQDTVTVTIPDDATPGLHWLRFHNEHGATDLKPFIVGLVGEVAETEPNNKPGEAQAVELPHATVNGVLEKTGEVDTFAVSLKTGQTLVVTMLANRDLGSPMDAVLQLLDSAGTVVVQNDDDHGFDPQLVFDVPTDGTYFVRTFAFPSAPNSTIRLAGAATYVYRLTMTIGPVIDHTVPAVVNSGNDAEVFAHGWNLSEEQESFHIPKFQRTSFVLSEGLTLPTSVAAVDHVSAAETNDPQALQIPSSVTGVIATAGETDTHQFAAAKGQKLTFRADARSMYSPLDPVLKVTAEDGKLLKAADDVSRSDLDSQALVTIPADGVYTATVTDRFNSGGARFVYVLTCTETKTTFQPTLKGNAFVLPVDKPLEIPVTIARDKGFAEKLAVTIEGLPEGIVCEPVHSEKEGDSAKEVTLKITRGETAAAFSGPVTIVCTPEESKQPVTAESPILNSKMTTSRIWLTVIVPPAKEAPAESKEDAESE